MNLWNLWAVLQQAGEPPSNQGKRLFEGNLDLIEKVIGFVSARHHLNPDEREEFRSYVFEKLIESDYHKLRQFRGDSSFSTFLNTVIGHLFVDHCHARWGRWRPSAPAKQLGPAAVLIDRLQSRDGHSVAEIVEIVMRNPDLDLTEVEIRNIAAKLPARVRPRTDPDPDKALEHVPDPAPGPDALLAQQELDARRRTVRDAVTEIQKDWNGEDKLIYRMRFDDDFKPAAIAAALKVDVKHVYARIDAIKGRLERGMKARGIDVDWLLGESDEDEDSDDEP